MIIIMNTPPFNLNGYSPDVWHTPKLDLVGRPAGEYDRWHRPRCGADGAPF
jgi:hypothetical protein